MDTFTEVCLKSMKKTTGGWWTLILQVATITLLIDEQDGQQLLIQNGKDG